MADIDHVVVLMLENRSFDHMLGFLEHPDPEFDGLLRGGPYTNPGWNGGSPVAATPQAKRVLPVGPDHSHDAVLEQLSVPAFGPRRPSNQGFVTSYERKCRGLAAPSFGGLLGPLVNRLVSRRAAKTAPAPERGPLVMLCQPPEQIPVLGRLALDFAVCTRWFCSVPGETWPNRNYAHAATSDGETEIALRPYTDRTIFELLEEHGQSWHVYHDDTPQLWAFPALWDTPERHANWYPSADFAAHVGAGALPAYSWIEPNHRPPLHTPDHQPVLGGSPSLSTSQHPENNGVANAAYDAYVDDGDTDFARGESLIAMVYEALRANPDVFQRTLLLITYDEHGGLYDHVPPPVGVPSPGDPIALSGRLLGAIFHRRTPAFDFTMLGPRVPAVVVSPYVSAGTVDGQTHDHASIPATLRALFAPQAAPLTARDAWAAPFHRSLTLPKPRTDADLPDLSAYVAPARPAMAASADLAAGPEAVPDIPTDAKFPHYYDDFVAQADQVQQHLADVGEPEVAGSDARQPVERAVEVSAAFASAASRHREEAAAHLG